VRPFPDVEESRFPVSSSGGQAPLWSRTGLDLYYERSDACREPVPMRARLTFQPRFEAVEAPAVAPSPFAVRYSSGLPEYEVLPEGHGIITRSPKGSDRPIQLVLVQDFYERLRRLVGGD
jgi:hypothetical protein